MSIASLYNKAYNKILPYLLKLLVFFTPLLVFTGTKEKYELPKIFFIYILGGTIMWLFLVKKMLNKERFKKINSWVILFVSGYVISTIFSKHHYTSLWGYYTRFNGGLISVLIFFGLYNFFINELTREKIKELINIACFSIIPIGLYGIWQHFSGIERIYATLGQANWLAAFLVMLIPNTILNSLNKTNLREKWLWVFTYTVAFAALWYTYSLSGILGVGAGIAVFTLLNLQNIKRNIKTELLLATIAVLVIITQPGIFKTKVRDIFTDLNKMTLAQKTHANESEEQLSDPVYIRSYLWRGTINMISSNPKRMLTGTGPETFPYGFQKHRPEKLNYSSEWNFVFNKPHNYYLELFATIGLLGAVPYLVVIIKSINKRDKFFTPGLIGLYITNIFGWPTVVTTLLFWSFLAGTHNENT